ncbi:integrase [Xanthomonas hyacinthi]|uniref:KfrA N-terminal DNA-binding domain-containing protein n=1 Tax=Xanthomonas hyacinthi TaxID=56455 RepID=A0A2S7EPG3_9XANT|nr:DNA-binding protein [Xanthomonas hyacinthi]KLD77068.1 hypothetical protein Y886_17810 [Xanthomonas hyacinthi DSM 19077]PPU94422.1 hypothetical protein XhyaCFBP1156_20150 [Xanthomonas hyacinthi]QGY78862.1 integrase [Xanthomonas hyacinthi]
MARGITESDVHAAADALVAGGERPTVERVRAHMGTGSPNTVVRLLETWWQGLGDRLDADRSARLAVADVPVEVAELTGKWWMLALSQARTLVTKELSGEHAALVEARQLLDQDREASAAETATIRAKIDASRAAEQLALARSKELERLVEQLQRQIIEVTSQRDAATDRVNVLDKARESQSRVMEIQVEAARSERDRMAEHVRATEDRAHAEIDRARQEAKDLQAQITSLTKQRSAFEQSQAEKHEKALNDLADARRALATHQARADALENQLTKAMDLPDALKRALEQSFARPAKRSRATRTPQKAKAAQEAGE